MSAPDPGLYEVTPETDVVLSKRYADPVYRVTGGRKPNWPKIDKPGPRASCDECFAVQHETRGQPFRLRSQPRRHRIVNGTVLALCARHVAAWKERDAADIGTPATGTKTATPEPERLTMATKVTPKTKRYYRDRPGRSAIRTLELVRIEGADAHCTVVRIDRDGVVTRPGTATRMTLRRLTGPAFIGLDSAEEATELEGA